MSEFPITATMCHTEGLYHSPLVHQQEKSCIMGSVVVRSVGGLHISRVPCDNCGGKPVRCGCTSGRWHHELKCDATPCPSCVDGMTFSDELAIVVGEPIVEVITALVPNSAWEPKELGLIALDALMVAAQTRDTDA